MKLFKQQFFILFVVFCVFGTTFPAFAKENISSKSVKLASYEGTITIYKADAVLNEIMDGMRLFDNYSIKTADKSYAYLELDDSKFVKVDQSSNIKIQKKGKKNTLLVQSGGLFFNVTKPLAADESLKVRTANMTMGVRGTTGSVCTRSTFDATTNTTYTVIDAQIYTGKGYFTITNELTDEQEEYEIDSGTHIEVALGSNNEPTNIVVEPLGADGRQIPAVAQGELIKMPDILTKIKETTNIDVSALQTTYEQKKQIEEDKAHETVSKLETIAKAQTTIANVTVVPFEKEQQESTPRSSNDKKNPIGGGESIGGDSGNTEDDGNVGGDSGNIGDDGSSDEDGGNTEDGGSSDEDGGSTEDGGSSDEDGGSTEDGGSSDEDGSSTEDGGSSDEDGSDEPTPPIENPEAAIGDTKYATLEEAIEQVQAGQTITLLKNKTISENFILSERLKLFVPNNIKLQLSNTMQVYGSLTIADGGILKAPIGGTFAIYENGSVTLNGNKNKFMNADGTALDATTALPTGQYYYFNNKGTFAWQAVQDIANGSGFINDIAANELYRIPNGQTNVMVDDWTWTISGRLILDGTFKGPSINPSVAFINIERTGSVYVSENSNFVDKDNHPFIGVLGCGKYQWNNEKQKWVLYTIAKIDNEYYSSIEDAFLNAKQGETVELIPQSNEETIYTINTTIPSGITVSVGELVHVSTGENDFINNGTLVFDGTSENKSKFIVKANTIVTNNGQITVNQNGVLDIIPGGSIENLANIYVDGKLVNGAYITGGLSATITFGANTTFGLANNIFFEQNGNYVPNADGLKNHTFRWNANLISNLGGWQKID